MRPLMCLAMPAKDFDTTFRRAGEVNDDVFRLLDLNSQHPLFLFVNYMDAHSPYLAPLHLQDKFRVGPTLGLDGLNDTMLQAARDNGRDFPELLQLRAQYDAGIAAEDEAFGALMQRLKARGIYDEALIIVTGDHGETFGQRGLMVHGTSVYADQTPVPLAIKYPRQKTPAVVTQSVSHVDLLPTVMDTLGYPAPAHVQGQSLRAVAGLAADRAVFTESFPTTDFPGGDRTDRAIRYGSMKLILSTTGRLELYDLARDPAERNNLYSFDNPHVAVLEPLLRQWIRQIPKADKKATPADEKELLRLKSLGYTQ